MSVSNEHKIKSYDRKMKLFFAIDEAFANINAEFDKEGNAPSFQEMRDAIGMLAYKVEQMEADARFYYNMVSKEEKKDDKIGIN